jgi:hypothetical protein
MRRDRFYHVSQGFETAFGGAHPGKRVLVTGHTGFKGSWLALWLRMLGAEVSGFALAPDTRPSHWELLDLKLPRGPAAPEAFWGGSKRRDRSG